MSKAKRTVRAHLDRSGIVIFRLLQGIAKPRIVHTFGYGTHHKIWLEVHDCGDGLTSMSAESAGVVKEQIAKWAK